MDTYSIYIYVPVHSHTAHAVLESPLTSGGSRLLGGLSSGVETVLGLSELVLPRCFLGLEGASGGRFMSDSLRVRRELRLEETGGGGGGGGGEITSNIITE